MSSATDLDVAAVDQYLSDHLAGYQGPLSARKFAQGQSNPTFELTTPNASYVLRRKPPGVLLKSAHAVDREFRVQRALAASDVPVAKMHLLCEDDTVIGSAFYVMERVVGQVHGDPRLVDVDKSDRDIIFNALNATLAVIHSVDLGAVGLLDFGPPGNYVARQTARWTKQYRATETEPIPDMDRLIARLDARIASGFGAGQQTLVHGDYRIDNMILSDDHRVAAVLDWELSTLGDPFADLASVIMQWRMPAGSEGRGLAGVDRAAEGLPSDEDFIASYCDHMGISEVPDFGAYLAFSFFRMGAVLQGVKKRALDGNASNPAHALKLGAYVPLFAENGLAALDDD